jgi:hypothetical protein
MRIPSRSRRRACLWTVDARKTSLRRITGRRAAQFGRRRPNWPGRTNHPRGCRPRRVRPGHAPPRRRRRGGRRPRCPRGDARRPPAHVSSRHRVLRQYATSFATFREASTEECGPSRVRAPPSSPGKRTGVERVRLAAIRARSRAPSIALPRARTAAGGRAPPRSRTLPVPWSRAFRWRVALRHRGRRALRGEDRQARRNAVALTRSALPLLVRSGGLGGRVDMYRAPSPARRREPRVRSDAPG